MIKVRYKENTANRLLQYSMGRILAEHLGFAFKAKPIDGFDLQTELDGTVGDGQKLVLDSSLGLPEYIDLRTVEALVKAMPQSPTIVLDSFFQHARNYLGHVEKMKRWIPDASVPLSYDMTMAETWYSEVQDPEVTCVHVRLGDYERLGLVVDIAYYWWALTFRPAKRILVFTDSPEHAYLDGLSRVGAVTVVDAPWQVAFNAMRRARKLVIANSTFSWLAALLGSAETVSMPWNWSTNWSDNEGADLRVTDGAWAVLRRQES